MVEQKRRYRIVKIETKLKDLREDRDLKQREIAKLIKTTQSYYSQLENGQKMITVDRLIKLAKFYNVSTDYILGLTNSKKKEW